MDKTELLALADQLDHRARTSFLARSSDNVKLDENAASALRRLAAAEPWIDNTLCPDLEECAEKVLTAARGADGEKSDGGAFSHCSSCEMPRTCWDHDHCFGPSDRPADVTMEELTSFIRKNGDLWMNEKEAARALIGAYEIRRR